MSRGDRVEAVNDGSHLDVRESVVSPRTYPTNSFGIRLLYNDIRMVAARPATSASQDDGMCQSTDHRSALSLALGRNYEGHLDGLNATHERWFCCWTCTRLGGCVGCIGLG